MAINTGQEPEKAIEEWVKEGIVQETDIYKHLGMVFNKLGHLKDMLDLNGKCGVINREINATAATKLSSNRRNKDQTQTIRDLSNPSIARWKAWGKVGKDGMKKIEKIQGTTLKRLLNLPISTWNIGLIMKQAHGQRTKEHQDLKSWTDSTRNCGFIELRSNPLQVTPTNCSPL